MNRQVLRRYAQSALMPLLAIFTALVAGGVIIWLAGPRLQGEWFGIKFVLDGYAGLFATGDMAWEFGPAGDYTKLETYERALEGFIQAHPTMCGVCQYHADVLPGEALQTGLVLHPGIFESESLSRVNPRYAPA